MGFLVTGAASGIGLAASRVLLRHAPVVIADVDESRLRAAAAELGPGAVPWVTDVRDPDACAAAVRAADEQGGLDGVAHCAGIIAGDGPLLGVDLDALRAIVDVNLFGAVHVLRAGVQTLMGRGGGPVVLVSSVAALQGRRRIAGYTASKAAVVGLARSAVADYGARGVRVNVVCPGPTDTAMTAGLSERMPLNPLGRMALPEEVGATVAWLLSSDAAWLNGVVLPVDAGESAVSASALPRGPQKIV